MSGIKVSICALKNDCKSITVGAQAPTEKSREKTQRPQQQHTNKHET